MQDERFHSMEAEHNQWVIFNCEPDLWMLMVRWWTGPMCSGILIWWTMLYAVNRQAVPLHIVDMLAIIEARQTGLHRLQYVVT